MQRASGIYGVLELSSVYERERSWDWKGCILALHRIKAREWLEFEKEHRALSLASEVGGTCRYERLYLYESHTCPTDQFHAPSP